MLVNYPSYVRFCTNRGDNLLVKVCHCSQPYSSINCCLMSCVVTNHTKTSNYIWLIFSPTNINSPLHFKVSYFFFLLFFKINIAIVWYILLDVFLYIHFYLI